MFGRYALFLRKRGERVGEPQTASAFLEKRVEAHGAEGAHFFFFFFFFFYITGYRRGGAWATKNKKGGGEKEAATKRKEKKKRKGERECNFEVTRGRFSRHTTEMGEA